MKLVIQIPCYNEADTLPGTLADLPRDVPGFESVEWLIINDGSTDDTVQVARRNSFDHIVELSNNQGLAAAIVMGIEASLRAEAGVIVNTDVDNQYSDACIARLTEPILDQRAQIMICARLISMIEHFSPIKRRLQAFGSWIVRKASNKDMEDAPSGFRAFHRDTALRLYVFNRYTYTLETIIQAGRLGIPIVSVPVEVNGPKRESRLIKSVAQHIWRFTSTILRIAVLYSPLRFFTALAAITMLPTLWAFVRFLYLYAIGEGYGHIQSLVICTSLIAMGALTLMVGILADLVAASRSISADIRAQLLRAELAR